MFAGDIESYTKITSEDYDACLQKDIDSTHTTCKVLHTGKINPRYESTM